MTNRILEAVCADPWLITESGMRQIVAIAERQADLEAFLAVSKVDPASSKPQVDKRGDTAIIPVRGPIFRYANLLTNVSGATSVQVLARDIAAAEADPAVRAIVLAVDSPGGQAAGIADLVSTIKAIEKPITAYVDNQAALAAYWLAAATSEVVISRAALVGNVGVAVSANVNKRDGIIEIVSSQSPKKRPDLSTEAGRAQVQTIVDDLAAVFISDIARLRDLSEKAVLAWEGDVRLGSKAVAVGMADRIGNLTEVIRGRPLVPRSDQPRAVPVSATQAFHDAVSQYEAAGRSRADAIRMVARHQPDLHERYLTEVNGG